MVSDEKRGTEGARGNMKVFERFLVYKRSVYILFIFYKFFNHSQAAINLL